jgi:hypothetical protein
MLIANLSQSMCGRIKAKSSREEVMTRNIVRLAAPLAAIGATLLPSAPWAQTAAPTNLGIEVLSSRPELVTGGDALVRIRVRRRRRR